MLVKIHKKISGLGIESHHKATIHGSNNHVTETHTEVYWRVNIRDNYHTARHIPKNKHIYLAHTFNHKVRQTTYTRAIILLNQPIHY